MGWGGGKIIKDATAIPTDVVTGKVFYNNSGKAIGTHKEKFSEMTFNFNKGDLFTTEYKEYTWGTGKAVAKFRISGTIGNYLSFYNPVISKERPYIYGRYFKSIDLLNKKLVGVNYYGKDLIINGGYDDIIFSVDYQMHGFDSSSTTWSAILSVYSINGTLYMGSVYFCEGEYAKITKMEFTEDVNFKLYFMEE